MGWGGKEGLNAKQEKYLKWSFSGLNPYPVPVMDSYISILYPSLRKDLYLHIVGRCYIIHIRRLGASMQADPT